MKKRMRRTPIRKVTESLHSDDLSDIKFFIPTFDLSHTNDSIGEWKVVKQVKDCINEIYTEHIHDLEQRKQKRLESKVPTEYFQPYNLVVNSAYQQRIRTYIQDLKSVDYRESLQSSLISSTDTFIEYLQKHVKAFDGKKGLLQAIIIYEAFHTLQNSITQIGAIIDDLIPKAGFNKLLKEQFNTKIATEYSDLLDTVFKKEHTDYLEDILRMRKSLESVKGEAKEICFELDVRDSDSCSEEDLVVEAYHNLPLDELVKIITQDSKKKVKKVKEKNRLGKKESLDSPGKEEEVDEEIEEFRQRLEQEKPFPVKSRPLVSEEFLLKLRQKLDSKIR